MDIVHEIYLAVNGGAKLEDVIPPGEDIAEWERRLDSYNPTPEKPNRLTPLRLGQLRQLRRLNLPGYRAAFAALKAGDCTGASEMIRQGMQDTLTLLTPRSAPGTPSLGPVVPPDCTVGESVAAMLGGDVLAERERQAKQRIAPPTSAQAEAMLRVALGAGGGSGLNVNRWSFGR